MKGAGSKRLPWPGRLAAALLALACASCIVVPIGAFTKSPYSPEVLQKLSAKGADRDRVRQVLGNPVLTKAKGAYWFYWNSRATWGIIGGSGSAVITDDEWLAVRFDSAGKVVFVEKNDLRKCLSNGMCFGGMAPSTDDAFAKAYQPKADECAVYLFLDRLPWPFPAGTVKYFVDGTPIGNVESDTYLFLARPAGNIDIAAYDLKISTKCIGGEKLYVKAVKKTIRSGSPEKIWRPFPPRKARRQSASAGPHCTTSNEELLQPSTRACPPSEVC
jgi:outer membrane protein assembly factor BamE (lipoprotein component of BamABCDE complex)